MKLLVVDNDRSMVEMLSAWLKVRGHQVHNAYTGEQIRAKWMEHKPDLVILESALQDVDALELCRELRREHDALVIVVTEGKDVHDEVRCLEAGADDYIRKPFFPNQLLARIQAVMRRTRFATQSSPSTSINIGPLSIDSRNNVVTIHGKTVSLTPTEGKFLSLLAANVNNVCTADQIVSHVWGFNNAGDSTLIRTHAYHLRQKIETDPARPRYLLTIPGIGYKLVQAAEEAVDPTFEDALQTSLAS